MSKNIARFALYPLLLTGGSFAGFAHQPDTAAETSQTTFQQSEAPWRATVRQFARDNFKHPAWGYSHSQRDYDLARELAATDGVKIDDDILFAAAFLHDIAAFEKWAEDGTDHADRATEVVGDILLKAGFDPSKIDGVNAAIRTHMYFRDPETPEALYLHDADALDWLGAIGVARIMALIDENGEGADGPAMAARLRTNLNDVPPRVLSRAGRRMLPDREEQLEHFLEILEAQTKALSTL